MIPQGLRSLFDPFLAMIYDSKFINLDTEHFKRAVIENVGQSTFQEGLKSFQENSNVTYFSIISLILPWSWLFFVLWFNLSSVYPSLCLLICSTLSFVTTPSCLSVCLTFFITLPLSLSIYLSIYLSFPWSLLLLLFPYVSFSLSSLRHQHSTKLVASSISP